jgi:hypothetical protein
MLNPTLLSPTHQPPIHTPNNYRINFLLLLLFTLFASKVIIYAKWNATSKHEFVFEKVEKIKTFVYKKQTSSVLQLQLVV